MRRLKVYKRMIYMYVGIIISLILALDIFFINLVFKNTLNSNLYINETLGKEINKRLIEMENYSNTVINTMYSDHILMNDISNFLKMDTITYLKNKLDKYSSENKADFNGIERFAKNTFLMNSYIRSISFISYERSEVSTFNDKNQIKVEKISDISEENKFGQGNMIIGKNRISFVRNITNLNSLKLEGKIIITYNLDKIMELIEKYDSNYEVLLLDSRGRTFFDSKEERKFAPYEHYEKIKDGDTNEKFELEKNYYVYKETNKLDITVISKFLESKTKILPKNFRYSIVGIDIIVFCIAMKLYIKRLTKLNERTKKILVAMEKVKSGELDIRLDIKKDTDDELKAISENFNIMCQDLKEHIDERYTAEIKRKKAELSALQSQINPHFLYNTLEGIRMKAVCNGDRDVAKMLYSLAFLFRNQIKEKERIMIKNEIEYCTQYVEIFKFRYEEVFSYKIKCDKEAENKEIIKFVLQPIIENYFVHGIELDKKDNFLEVNIFKKEKEINIEVKDNGKGIAEERINEINNYLEKGQGVGTSIGLSNANERIRIAYGINYGIKIKKGRDSGIIILINIPCKEVCSDEKCNDCR